jgi:hypothetical protein
MNISQLKQLLKSLAALLLLLVLVHLPGDSTAQRRKVQNLPKYDKQRIHFGFLLGINVTDFTIRRIPTFNSLDSRNLDYTFYENGKPTVVTKQIESSFLEFPLDIKFKSKRINNYRGYVLAGVKYSIDMVSQAKVENADKDFVKLKRKDFGYTIGLGFDFYLERFKFAPEIKMYHGLNNLLVDDPKIFSSSLSSLKSKIFLISFTFE